MLGIAQIGIVIFMLVHCQHWFDGQKRLYGLVFKLVIPACSMQESRYLK